ncbi:E3 SUMO-protein ligase KIAA1586-like [Paramisgurnus dabryanus]|uniref:E3 SUMO-protein ligase KIAA1586-like n=1 Tax=Paramisgurnus dabryanus TaxID=90735 RepID=UPI0031F3CBF0
MDSNSQPQQNSQSHVDSNEQGPYNPDLQANDSVSGVVGGCIEPGRFAKWREGREWLAVTTDGSVQCSACSDIRDLGPYTQERLHIDSAFINGIKAKSAKKLNDKISRHGKCQSHIKCIEILQRRRETAIEKAVDNSAALWRKHNEKTLKVTENCIRTAYMICQNNLSFKIQPQLVELQQLNGVNLGYMLHSDKACRNMLMFIGEKMRTQLVDFIKNSSDKLSILIDESTTVSNKTCLIIYIRIPYEGEVCNFFLQLVELQSCTGSAICDTLLQSLYTRGISEDMLRTWLIGFATDGAAAMMGRYRGAATLLREKINPNLTVIHCMNHKLELAVHDAVKHITEASHFQMFIDSLYSFFSQSPKHMREFESAASDLGMHARRIGRVFDVRWLSSSCTSVTALWQSYPALVKLFGVLMEDKSRSSVERAKCQGIHGKMTEWLFLVEMALVKDALETLQALSLFLQRRDATAVSASAEVDVALRTLRSMRQADGVNARGLKEEFESLHSFKGVNVSQPSDSDHRKAEVFRERLFVSLADNIERRLDDNGIISDAAVLNPSNWPSDEDERILYGDNKLLTIRKTLAVEAATSTILLKEFHQFKCHGTTGDNLRKVLITVSTLPVSTAECERGFSAMNRILTDERNRINVSTLNNLLFISINGPEVAYFPARRFAEMWIKEGRHAADDAPTGKQKKTTEVHHQGRLFS